MPAAESRFIPELHPKPQFGFDGLLLAGNLVVAGTGHRADDRRPGRGVGSRSNTALHQRVKSWMRMQLVELAPARIISGMALEVDTWLAELAIELRIPFTAAIPFEGQEDRWPPDAQQHYMHLLDCAAEVVNVSGQCSPPEGYPLELVKKFMDARNRYMVDRCGLLLAVWDGTPGGTGNTVDYAKRVKKPMRRLNPAELRGQP